MKWGEWIHTGIGTFEMDRLRTADPKNYELLIAMYNRGKYTVRKQRRIKNKEVEIRYLLCPTKFGWRHEEGSYIPNETEALKITETFEELMPYINLLVGA